MLIYLLDLTLTRIIRENNYTRKRTRTRHYPETRYRKPINLKNIMKAFYTETDKYSLNKIISIDETSIYAQMVSSYSRCKLGKRCVKKTKDNKPKRQERRTKEILIHAGR